jgi:hypothetical protein
VSLADLLWWLEALDVRVSLRPGRQLGVGPASRLTPALSEAIREHKEWVVRLALRVEYGAAVQEGDGTLVGALRDFDEVVPADWRPPPASEASAVGAAGPAFLPNHQR